MSNDVEDAEELEEERRLAFVGMTRAKEELYLCHAGLREFRGMARYAIASQFLSQLPAEGIERIKFITNFPRDMSDDLLDAVRSLPKVCPYLHVPAQSGCNTVLKRMKRLYTVEYYREMLARLPSQPRRMRTGKTSAQRCPGGIKEAWVQCSLRQPAGLRRNHWNTRAESKRAWLHPSN